MRFNIGSLNISSIYEWFIVSHTFNASTQQAETDRSKSSRSTWSKKLVLVQLGLERETVLKTYKEAKFLQTTTRTKEDISIKYNSAIIFKCFVCVCVCN